MTLCPLQLNKRFNGIFQGTIAYTWSHELDENQESGQQCALLQQRPDGALQWRVQP